MILLQILQYNTNCIDELEWQASVSGATSTSSPTEIAVLTATKATISGRTSKAETGAALQATTSWTTAADAKSSATTGTRATTQTASEISTTKVSSSDAEISSAATEISASAAEISATTTKGQQLSSTVAAIATKRGPRPADGGAKVGESGWRQLLNWGSLHLLLHLSGDNRLHLLLHAKQRENNFDYFSET